MDEGIAGTKARAYKYVGYIVKLLIIINAPNLPLGGYLSIISVAGGSVAQIYVTDSVSPFLAVRRTRRTAN